MKNKMVQSMFLILFSVLLIITANKEQKDQMKENLTLLQDNQMLVSGVSYLSKEALNEGLVVAKNHVVVVATKSPEEEFYEEYGIYPYEYEILCKCVEAEAGSTAWNTKRAVTEVILNRIASPGYPNSVESVIFQPYQFEIIKNGHYEVAIPSDNTRECVKMSLKERIYPANMLYFRDSCYFPEDKRVHSYMTIDNLYFSVKD